MLLPLSILLVSVIGLAGCSELEETTVESGEEYYDGTEEYFDGTDEYDMEEEYDEDYLYSEDEDEWEMNPEEDMEETISFRDEITIYLPGMSSTDLPGDVVEWLSPKSPSPVFGDTLSAYVFVNESTGSIFV